MINVGEEFDVIVCATATTIHPIQAQYVVVAIMAPWRKREWEQRVGRVCAVVVAV